MLQTMSMIFPRSRDNGNAGLDCWQLVGIVAMIAGLVLPGCASTPRTPANVVLRDAHNSGYVLAFDRASKTLASGGSEGRIRLWSLPAAREISGWMAHSGTLQGLQFISQDREIVSAGYDGVLARWTRDGALLANMKTSAPVTDMAIDEADALVLTGHSDGHVRLWRLTDFSPVLDLPLHHGAVRAVAYNPSTRQLASSGTDGRVYHWPLSGSPRALPSPPTDAQALAFSPDGNFLMGGGWFNLFRWRLSDESLTVLPTEHHGIVKSISFDSDGRRLASIGRQTDSAVNILDAQTGVVLKRFQPHELCGAVVRLSSDGHYLASTSDDASVYLWDLQHLLPEQSYFSEK